MEKLRDKLRIVQEEAQARIKAFRDQDRKYDALKEKCRVLGLMTRKVAIGSNANLDIFPSDRILNTLPSIHQKAVQMPRKSASAAKTQKQQASLKVEICNLGIVKQRFVVFRGKFRENQSKI